MKMGPAMKAGPSLMPTDRGDQNFVVDVGADVPAKA